MKNFSKHITIGPPAKGPRKTDYNDTPKYIHTITVIAETGSEAGSLPLADCCVPSTRHTTYILRIPQSLASSRTVRSQFSMFSFSDCHDKGNKDCHMCELSDTCAKIELTKLVLHRNAHPCAMTPICAVLNNIKAVMSRVSNAGVVG